MDKGELIFWDCPHCSNQCQIIGERPPTGKDMCEECFHKQEKLKGGKWLKTSSCGIIT